ncbi:MAG: Valine--tRNA ligase [Phycisphaerae bacterium]|nr:Valine--tRNA ligase [Phycisphaerae bacterium]
MSNENDHTPDAQAPDALPPVYDPHQVEQEVYRLWESEGHFHAEPDSQRQPYCIVIPPPNVTGALHLGHALNNTLQDTLIRWRRMQGMDAMWLPGTDHAGIATQSVVERRLKEEEGKDRHDLGREGLVDRIWAWKEQYNSRIISQLKMLGASCDWQRTRFTLDEVCARAVRHTFFSMFQDDLIYRGLRLVNWDTHLQTAVADDEVYHETVNGHFWHLRYPLADPGPGDPKWLIVATTRPETMLGDTAVAVNPADERYKQLVGRKVILPLLNRPIPIVADEWADPKLGSGCVKITPAHDPNDYEVGKRQNLPMINILNADGTVNANGGPYEGLDRYEARRRVVKDLQSADLIERIEQRQVEIGHSDRSNTPIEPWLSEQWYVRMGDLAERAMETVRREEIRIHPPRYAKTYLDWLSEKRDWPISRQLWWGHRIPIWYCDTCKLEDLERTFEEDDTVAWRWDQEHKHWLICAQEGDLPDDIVTGHRLRQDPDVLDTWFSSALWPFSTLGWPDDPPALRYWFPTSVLVTSRDIITLWVARMVMTAQYNLGQIPFHKVYIHAKILDGQGQTMSKSKGNGVDPLDIIELFGADALRMTLAEMTTETQDMRMPVKFRCPHCSHEFPQTAENMRQVVLPCPSCGKEMATRFASEARQEQTALARLTSEKFEYGRNFCNKLWNASRFAMMNLVDVPPLPAAADLAHSADRWILSRLAGCVDAVTAALELFAFHDAAASLYRFFWNDLCDWYLEIAKFRIRDGQAAPKAVLAHVLDQTLRLLHPIIPFITEAIWTRLNQQTPVRGRDGQPVTGRLIKAAWPTAETADRDAKLEAGFDRLQAVIRALRDLRSQYNVPPRKALDALLVSADAAALLQGSSDVIRELANIADLRVLPDEPAAPPNAASAVVAGVRIYLLDVIDPDAERQRLLKQQAELTQRAQQSRGKLANEGFVSRAKPEAVQRERDRLAQIESELAAVAEQLARL